MQQETDILQLNKECIVQDRARTYNNSHLEGITGKVTVKHLGMGIAETWRGSPDGRLRGFLHM